MSVLPADVRVVGMVSPPQRILHRKASHKALVRLPIHKHGPIFSTVMVPEHRCMPAIGLQGDCGAVLAGRHHVVHAESVGGLGPDLEGLRDIGG